MAHDTSQLVCPVCHSPIAESAKPGGVQLLCQNGHGPWPVRNGIPWFTDDMPEFDGHDHLGRESIFLNGSFCPP